MTKNILPIARIAGALALCLGLFTSAQAQTKVRLNTTMGDIVIELDAEKAPKSVDNFLRYVKSGHYDGVIFHRVIDNFMIQTGGVIQNKNGTLSEKPGRAPIPLESHNGLTNVRGSVAMARTSNPNSATSQFFINVKDNAFLDAANARDGNGYAVFGKVVEGMDVVDKIKVVPVTVNTGQENVPETPITITKATILASAPVAAASAASGAASEAASQPAPKGKKKTKAVKAASAAHS